MDFTKEQKRIYDMIVVERNYGSTTTVNISKSAEEHALQFAMEHDISRNEALEMLIEIGARCCESI